MAIDEQKVEEAVGKVFGELAVAVTGPLIVLGDRLGLWAAMVEAGPMTPRAGGQDGTVDATSGSGSRGGRGRVCRLRPGDGAFTLSDEMARSWPPTTARRR